ncbi:MAG: hypothetical protein A2021_03995 [Elusimicrobia bacterium GWF2_52_66]|nr:MAG: hypothetical protein A2X33_09665 [Elusimicrobia bacterium GWA2_51_34]OGR88423.1 MAG: hypothetical protein A2021_03995 [Elusimicrobia bacterium GWF2_52_66]HAF95020.1 hypothetical protein [Elusimicrobiota bacterium]HCE97963.1 hypothetical protein [Elusimicrobiota bacterium]
MQNVKRMTRRSASPVFHFSFFIFHFLLLSCFSAPARAYDLPSSTGAHHMNFSADDGQFNEYTRIINLKGNAHLKEFSSAGKLLKVIRAMEISVNMASRTAVFPGDFVIDDDSSTIYGKSGMFDYGSDSGFITDGRQAYKNFIFRGRRIEFNNRRYLYKKASLTSCDEEPAHYRIRASRLYMAPNRYFLAFNNVFFLGPIPLLYFPVLYRPLGEGTPVTSSFHPGYDGRNGFYIKSNFVYKFTPNVRGKLFLDYFEKKGFGTGAEVDYRKPEKNISNLSVYRIRETGALRGDRWGVNGGYWHSFNRFSESDPARYYSQSFFRLLSDPQFNNDFFRNNPFAISPDEQASIAFTRQSNYTTTRLSISEHYAQSPDLKSFHKDRESAPRLDFNTVPFKLGRLPVLNSFSGYFESAKEPGLAYYQRKGAGTWTMSKSVPFSKNVILSPSIFYNQSVFIATSAVNDDHFIGRYGSNVNMRYDRFWGALDLGYSYQRRLEVNRLNPDLKAPDKGEEASSVSSSLFIMPRSNFYIKTQTSYDMRDSFKAIYGFDSFSQRMSPLTSELYYSPSKSLEVFFADSYQFARGNQSCVAQVNVGDLINYTRSGIANYNSEPNVYVFNQGFGFRPRASSSWRIEGAMRVKAVAAGFMKFSELTFFEKSVILYKDFHDFKTMWTVRLRPGVRDFHFLINFRMNAPAVKDDLDEDSKKFWHPWRKEGEARD